MSKDLTLTELTHAIPKGLRHNATQDLVDKVNSIKDDDVVKEAYRDNLVSYASVLKDGRFQINNYLDAIRYITHKLMNKSNIDAYIATFPDRYQNFLTKGTSEKDIASYVSSYNKNKLVNMIREQTIIPTYILNADNLQKAINKQVQLISDDTVSHTVQQKAADSLMMHLKPPETSKVELDITSKSDEITEGLQKSLYELAAKQKQMIEQGLVTTKEVAESSMIIEGEVDD